MKATSIKSLQDIYQIAADLKTVYEGAEDSLNEIISLVKKVINAEAVSKDTKFNPYNYCSKFSKNDPDFMKATSCVHHQEGFKVCTDKHILIAYKSEYDSSLEGKNIMKDGTEFDKNYKYPNWKAVIPEYHESHETIILDYAYIKSLVDEAKVCWKLNLGTYIEIKGNYYSFELFTRFFDFCKEFNIMKVHIVPGRVMYVNNENHKAVVMPIVTSNGAEIVETEGINKVFHYC